MIAVLAAALAAPLPCGPLDLATALSLAVARSDEVAIKQAEVVGAEADRAITRAVAFFPGSTATRVPTPPNSGSCIQGTDTSNAPLVPVCRPAAAAPSVKPAPPTVRPRSPNDAMPADAFRCSVPVSTARDWLSPRETVIWSALVVTRLP